MSNYDLIISQNLGKLPYTYDLISSSQQLPEIAVSHILYIKNEQIQNNSMTYPDLQRN
jgi:hypothetical protein